MYFSFREKLESYKELQKLRQRPHGVNIVSLALGKRAAPEDEVLGVSSNKKASLFVVKYQNMNCTFTVYNMCIKNNFFIVIFLKDN